jgi:hypothetical protein
MRRHIQILIIVLIACSTLSIQSYDVSRVAAQPPPYPPLAPSLLKVMTSLWGSSNANASMHASPGDMNLPLYVTVQNIGNRTVTGLSETLFLQGPFTNVSGGQSIMAFYGQDISPGWTATTNFVLNIDRNASLGMHVLKMQADYLQVVAGTGATLYLSQQMNMDIPVLVTGTSYSRIYSVSVYPSQTTPAGNVTISGTIVDLATALLANTNVSISSPAFNRGAFVYIGELDPNIPRPFSGTIQVMRTITPGTYPLEISATYQDSLNVIHTDPFKTTIEVIQPVNTPTPRRTERNPLQELIADLWQIFRFFFGSLGFTILRDSTGGS